MQRVIYAESGTLTSWKLLKYITRITATKMHQGSNGNMGMAIFSSSFKLLSQEYENNEEI